MVVEREGPPTSSLPLVLHSEAFLVPPATFPSQKLRSKIKRVDEPSSISPIKHFVAQVKVLPPFFQISLELTFSLLLLLSFFDSQRPCPFPSLFPDTRTTLSRRSTSQLQHRLQHQLKLLPSQQQLPLRRRVLATAKVEEEGEEESLVPRNDLAQIFTKVATRERRRRW